MSDANESAFRKILYDKFCRPQRIHLCGTGDNAAAVPVPQPNWSFKPTSHEKPRKFKVSPFCDTGDSSTGSSVTRSCPRRCCMIGEVKEFEAETAFLILMDTETGLEKRDKL